ncbi:hypothetical protein OFN66_29840, partial [Escherichia coli]|nr:hypothetical protein [Escherichia coli]
TRKNRTSNGPQGRSHINIILLSFKTLFHHTFFSSERQRHDGIHESNRGGRQCDGSISEQNCC